VSRRDNLWQRKPYGIIYGNDLTGARTTDVTGKVGTLQGGATISGNTLVCDGVDNYLSIPDSADLSFTNGSSDLPFSIIIWFKTTAPTTRQFLISKRTLSIYEWQFEYRATSGAGLEFVMLNQTASTSLSRYDAGTTLTSGRWYCAAVTYSGSETTAGLKIYQDAVRVDDSGTNIFYAGMDNTTNPVSIGCLPTNVLPLSGAVGTTLIYNRELSIEEITREYNRGAARIALGGTP